MSKLHEAAKLGQAIWLDYIRRDLIAGGDLQALVDRGVRGLPSNPTIFEKAIAGSDDYDEQLLQLAARTSDVGKLYESIAVTDIRAAADVFRPLYDESEAKDGYVSLEVSPALARDTSGTIEQARELVTRVERPNLMSKVPATVEGIPAIRRLISEGINVNATLIFSIGQYRDVLDAYVDGLTDRREDSKDISRVASVASFFVSRVDAAVDRLLGDQGTDELRGKTAIANARKAYGVFLESCDTEQWKSLAASGAQVQRLLWASTGTKDPSYSDVLYVEELMGRDTVNTLPPATLDAFLDHGRATRNVEGGQGEARLHLQEVRDAGIDLDAVTRQLLEAGLDSFAASFSSLHDSIAEKRNRLLTTEVGTA